MTTTSRTIAVLSFALIAVASPIVTAQRGQGRPPAYMPMSGTFELESSRGGNPKTAAQAATRSLPPSQRERAYQSLLSRLEPPQTLAIDRNGRTITIASSRGPRSVFDADGELRSERGPNGRMINTRTEIVGDRLTVSTDGGSRGSDFSVTFQSQNNGDTLLVTRRLDDDDLPRPVTIESYYRRSSMTPQWEVYSERDYGPPAGMMVPDGMRLVATLDTPLSMRASRDGDPFTMTVRGPGEFAGARIDGRVSRVTGYREAANGRDIRIEFQTIQLGGRTSQFAALLNTVRLFDGTVLRVNPDGDVREIAPSDNQVKGGAIGAAVGAIIGAITGGGKGAAAGAIVGGAGGVILSQGHEQLDLQPGAEVTLTALSRYR